jgi:hypothetical protein
MALVFQVKLHGFPNRLKFEPLNDGIADDIGLLKLDCLKKSVELSRALFFRSIKRNSLILLKIFRREL